MRPFSYNRSTVIVSGNAEARDEAGEEDARFAALFFAPASFWLARAAFLGPRDFAAALAMKL